MSDRIQPGDVVQLKSGGPKMTVNLITKLSGENFESAECSWFDGNQVRKDHFSLVSLKKFVP